MYSPCSVMSKALHIKGGVMSIKKYLDSRREKRLKERMRVIDFYTVL